MARARTMRGKKRELQRLLRKLDRESLPPKGERSIPMQHCRSEPCSSCPFRRDVQYYDAVKAGVVAAQVVFSGKPWVCHEDADVVGDKVVVRRSPAAHCVGHSILLEKLGRRPKFLQESMDAGDYEPSLLHGWDGVYDSLEEFKRAHDPKRVTEKPEVRDRIAGEVWGLLDHDGEQR